MSILTIRKYYGDFKLLNASDIHYMWDDLEAKTNGNIDASNVPASWASWSQVTLPKDVNYYFGAAGSAYFKMNTATGELIFTQAQAGTNTLFDINAIEVARIDSSKNFTAKKDLYFPSDTTYPLYQLVARYYKPIIQYVSATQIKVENNTEFTNETLIVFPSGPVHVQEDVAVAPKCRQLLLTATANGYASGHAGACVSGLRVGLTLAANTWYFVYIVKVTQGTDIGKFLLAVDDTQPKVTNYGTLDTRYGAGQWVYLGAFRYGFGSTQTTTMIPFVYDHQGWCKFSSRSAASDYHGIRVVNSSLVSTSTATGWSQEYSIDAANSGMAAPDTMSAIQMRWRAEQDGDSLLSGNVALGTSASAVTHYLASFGNLFDNSAHADEFIVPNGKGYKFLAQRIFGDVNTDFNLWLYISGFLDEAI